MQMGALPFPPHPPKYEQQVLPGQSSTSSLQLSGDTGNVHDEAEQPDAIKDFLNLSAEDASDASFHGENQAFAFAEAEQMEFQFLSEQLGIAIADNEESPQLDRLRSEAYESGRPDHLSCKESFAEKKASSDVKKPDGASAATRLRGREGVDERACAPWWRSIGERSDVSRTLEAEEPAKGLRLGLRRLARMRAEGRSVSVARKALAEEPQPGRGDMAAGSHRPPPLLPCFRARIG
ncbi:hypothetical protein ZWY2020_001813 [Hordeum vulgare]|nr:hypothetical protein ZWY2020_001813 [Hordeum vulgare]